MKNWTRINSQNENSFKFSIKSSRKTKIFHSVMQKLMSKSPTWRFLWVRKILNTYSESAWKTTLVSCLKLKIDWDFQWKSFTKINFSIDQWLLFYRLRSTERSLGATIILNRYFESAWKNELESTLKLKIHWDFQWKSFSKPHFFLRHQEFSIDRSRINDL